MSAFVPSPPLSRPSCHAVAPLPSLSTSFSHPPFPHAAHQPYPTIIKTCSNLSPPPSLAPLLHPTVVWLRDDLRLDDHPALVSATSTPNPVAPLALLPVNPTPFHLAALHALRTALRARGGDLYIRRVAAGTSAAAATVAAFCSDSRASGLVFHRGMSQVARQEEEAVTRSARALGVSVRAFWTNCLVCPGELPFAVADMPEDCDQYAAQARASGVRPPQEAPKRVSGVVGVACGEIPMTEARGGEAEGLARVREYVGGGSLVGKGNGIGTALGGLGPFLRLGCVSPRRMWFEVRRGVRRESVRRYCAELELWLGDFVRLITLKHGVVPT